MDGFSGYNQINIVSEDQHKTAFICPWGTFAYRKLPFGLKNAGTNFQRAMSYAFHDIKHIVQPYLDDLPNNSMPRVDHPKHLRAIFVHCRFYRICLNPHNHFLHGIQLPSRFYCFTSRDSGGSFKG
jgi:hypothetical protein